MRINKRRPHKKWVHVLLRLGLFLLVAIALFKWAFWNQLTIREYEIKSTELRETVRIAVLADFHNSSSGTALMDALEKVEPDLVVIPGDLDDSGVNNENARALLEAIGRTYPCYYVTGNHEFWTGRAVSIVDLVRASGVTVLQGESVYVTVGNQTLRIAGIDDPDGVSADQWRAQLAACTADDDVFSILLSHRPERGDDYRDSGFDLVLAGHAHGGQIRIPLILNGLYAPNQGWFPRYAGGRYRLGETTMIVSRGLQNWGLPRIFNPPELVVVDLVPK